VQSRHGRVFDRTGIYPLNALCARLAKAGAGDFKIGFCPDVPKTHVGCGEFGRIFVLSAQTFGQSVKRPAVVGQAPQIFAVNLLGFSKAACFHEVRANGMT
jgi:hypothetical protein